MPPRRVRPKRPIQDSETFEDMPFPLNGIDVSVEYEMQPPQTTPKGINVRGYEPGTLRGRGGSRNGLIEYIPLQVSGTNVIQHLNYVVDPTEAALLTGFDPLDGGGAGGVADPSTNNLTLRNPGRFVRTGGSGIALNRHRFTSRKLTPMVTPRNIKKTQGTNYNFAGTEFSASGLFVGDLILSVTLSSAGSPASAALGTYPIGASLAVGNASFAYNLAHGFYNPVVYNLGIMTVVTSGGAGGYVLVAQNGTSGGASSTSVNFTLGGVPDTTSTCILVCVHSLTAMSPTISVTDNLGTTYSIDQNSIVGATRISLWHGFPTNTGALTVTVTTTVPGSIGSVSGQLWTDGDGITVPSWSGTC